MIYFHGKIPLRASFKFCDAKTTVAGKMAHVEKYAFSKICSVIILHLKMLETNTF
jgi:hypothetical protein